MNPADRAQTAWGTRAGADDEDAYRMIRVSRKAQEAGHIGMCSNAAPPAYGEKSTHRYTTSREKLMEEP